MFGKWKGKFWKRKKDDLITVDNVSYRGKEPVVEGEELLSIHGVDLSYTSKTGSIKALENINFQIYRGEFICVLGPSGCGKSTLLKILAGFLRPTSGSVKLSGVEISGTDWHRGVVFQHPPLYPWFSVRNNVSFGPRMRHIQKNTYQENVDAYLKKVHLEAFADKKIYELSGGMKQRVAIARALINDPEILLMDEPFSALDALTREDMQNMIREIWTETDKTIFFITHDVEEALLLANRIIVLSDHPGRIVDDIPVDFSTRLSTERTADIKFSQEFYQYRERLLRLINA